MPDWITKALVTALFAAVAAKVESDVVSMREKLDSLQTDVRLVVCHIRPERADCLGPGMPGR